jgi:hypothetical protein
MTEDKSWVDECMRNCMKSHATVTDVAAARLQNLLKGKGQERLLTPTELSSTAIQLMRDMLSAPKSTDGGGNAN